MTYDFSHPSKKPRSVTPPPTPTDPPAPRLDPHAIRRLQQTHGNQAVMRMLGHPATGSLNNTVQLGRTKQGRNAQQGRRKQLIRSTKNPYHPVVRKIIKAYYNPKTGKLSAYPDKGSIKVKLQIMQLKVIPREKPKPPPIKRTMSAPLTFSSPIESSSSQQIVEDDPIESQVSNQSMIDDSISISEKTKDDEIEDPTPLFQAEDLLKTLSGTSVKILEVLTKGNDVGYRIEVNQENVFNISEFELEAKIQTVEVEDEVGLGDAFDPTQMKGNEPELKHLLTNETVSLTKPDERKQAAHQAFTKIIDMEANGEKQFSVNEIMALLPKIQKHFELRSVSGIIDNGIWIEYIASPPDYAHVTPVGAKVSDESNHPTTSFSAKKPELVDESSDSGLATPLGAIKNQLSLAESDINLLAKGDLLTADRPKRVRATIVGSRRGKGSRTTGEVTPASIAHLGHHENILLNLTDNKKWLSFFDGGHLIGDQMLPNTQFDTFKEWNLAPQEQVLNQQSYRLWLENIIATGPVDKKGKVHTSIPISVIASVYYSKDDYTVSEDDLAKYKIIPDDGSGNPKSGQHRTVTIPARVPYRWVLDAKIDDANNTFQDKSTSIGKNAKTGNTAFPYFDYNDLTTKTIPYDDRHWWKVTGATKKTTGGKEVLSNPTKAKNLHLEAYQYDPKL